MVANHNTGRLGRRSGFVTTFSCIAPVVAGMAPGWQKQQQVIDTIRQGKLGPLTAGCRESKVILSSLTSIVTLIVYSIIAVIITLSPALHQVFLCLPDHFSLASRYCSIDSSHFHTISSKLKQQVSPISWPCSNAVLSTKGTCRFRIISCNLLYLPFIDLIWEFNRVFPAVLCLGCSCKPPHQSLSGALRPVSKTISSFQNTGRYLNIRRVKSPGHLDNTFPDGYYL